LYIQHECDDPYYPSYNDVIGVYKYKENAIKRAKKSFYRYAEKCITKEERKYGGVDGNYFEDNEDNEDNEKKIVNKNDTQVYIIYDKEEDEKRNTRWEKMHGVSK
jgi:hypothetical protein